MGYIYAYTKQSYIDHQDDHFRGAIKIGYTSRTPDERIKEQDSTSDAEPLILQGQWQIADALGEFDVVVHAYLEKQGYRPTRTDAKREWYTIAASTTAERLAIIGTAIQEASKDPNAGRVDLRLTPSQYENLETLLDRFDGGDKTIIAELCPRFGKTLWAISALLTSTERVLVVAAYWLSSLPSFRSDIAKFTQFSNVRYVDTNDADYAQQVQEHLARGLKVVIGVSLCGGSNRRDIKKEDLQPVVDITDKIMFVDEADYGAWQVNQRELVDFLGSGNTKLILATGTNAARASTGRQVDHHLCVTYFDMLISKRGGATYTPRRSLPFVVETDLSMLPEVEFYQLAFPKIIDDTVMNKDNLPSWNKAFENPAKAKGFLRSCFGALFNGTGVYEYMNMHNVFGAQPAGVMIWLPEGGRKENVDKFAVMLQEWIPEWHVMPLHGDATDNRRAEEEVKKAHAWATKEGKNGVVVVSMKMGARSFSVPEIDTTILAYDNGSAAQTAQKSSRVLTRGHVGKIGRVLSLSLDPTREDKLDAPILETAQKLADKDGIDIVAAVKVVLRTLNVYFMDDEHGEKMHINVDEYTKKVLSLNSLSKIVAKTADVATILQDPDMVAALLQVRAQDLGGLGKEKPENIVEKGKKFLGGNGRVNPKATPDNDDERALLTLWMKIEKAIAALTSNMAVIAGMTPCTTIQGALAHMDSKPHFVEAFESEFGTTPSFVLDLLNAGIISSHLINLTLNVDKTETTQAIADFWA